MKNKDIILAEYIQNKSVNLCVVTETWLAKNTDELDAWISTYELTKYEYFLDAVSRESRGRGMVLSKKE